MYRPYPMLYVAIYGVDSGRTSMNYVSILSGKYSALTVNGALVQRCNLWAPFTWTQALITFHWEYTRSQHDVQLTEVNKVTCMPHWRCELANCPGVLMLHWAFLPLKMAAQYLSTFLSCAVLHKVCTWNVGVRGSHICEFGPVYSFHLTLNGVTWPRRGTYLGWSWPCSQAVIKSGSGLGMRLGTF